MASRIVRPSIRRLSFRVASVTSGWRAKLLSPKVRLQASGLAGCWAIKGSRATFRRGHRKRRAVRFCHKVVNRATNIAADAFADRLNTQAGPPLLPQAVAVQNLGTILYTGTDLCMCRQR